MECQRLRQTARGGDLTLRSVITQKQENDHAFRLKPPRLFAQKQEQTEDCGCVLRELELHPQKPFEPRRLCMHTVLKRNNNRAQGIAGKCLCTGGEWRWDWQAGENAKPFSSPSLVTVPLRGHWSQHMVLWTKYQRLEIHSSGCWRMNIVAAFVDLITVLQSLTILLHETTSNRIGKGSFMNAVGPVNLSWNTDVQKSGVIKV